LTELFEK